MIGRGPGGGAGPDERGGPPDGVPDLGSAVLFLLGIALLHLVGGLGFQIAFGEAGLAIGQLLFLVAPSLLYLRLGGHDVVRSLSLRWPSAGEVGGGVLVLMGGVQLAWILAWLQTFVLPIPTEYLEAISETLGADSLGRLVWLLFLAAFLPAIAEETVFRGVFLSGLRTRLPGMRAAVVAGLVFGLFHLMPGTAFRFVPTAWLGFLLGAVVVTTSSLPLSALLHFLNNAVVLVVASSPAMQEDLADPQVRPPLVVIPVGAALLGWGARILVKEKKRREARPAGGGPSAEAG